MKKHIGLVLIITLIISFFLGLYLHKLSDENKKIAFETEYKKIESENVIRNAQEVIEETSSLENVITPNTKIIEKLYYNECKHLKEIEKEAGQNLINRNESELQIQYIGWEIQKFTPSEVVVYKEVNDFCDEHYLLKDVDGNINIYKLDKYGKEKELIKKTDIKTKYLPDVDLENLRKGIKACGNMELNAIIQDYE